MISHIYGSFLLINHLDESDTVLVGSLLENCSQFLDPFSVLVDSLSKFIYNCVGGFAFIYMQLNYL